MALLVVCTGCGESPTSSAINAGVDGVAEDEAVSQPAALETFDQDRLYMLLMGIAMESGWMGCGRYYRDPDNPEWKFIAKGDLSKVCPEIMGKVAAYLVHNGVAGVELAHLEALAFWDRMQAQTEAIKECQKQLGGNIFGPPPDPTKPKRRDFPDYKAYRKADEEYGKRRAVQHKEHKRA